MSYLISTSSGLVIKFYFLSLMPTLHVFLWRASCDLHEVITVQIPVKSVFVLVAVRRQPSFPLSDVFAGARTTSAATTARTSCGCVVRIVALFARCG